MEIKLRHFTYDGYEVPVLKDVDFLLHYGQITLLSGPSGSGKSTLLSLMNGIIPRMTGGTLEGEILLDGKSIEGLSMSQLSLRVGTVLQNAEAQIIHQTVEDEIAFGCENVGKPPEEIARRISTGCSAVHLEPGWKTRTLSGGQKQRLITASTLAMEPDILIFDEPLANLDRQGALELLHLLKQLAAQGKAILLVEHRLDLTLPHVDVIWHMEDGTPRPVEDRMRHLQQQYALHLDCPPQKQSADPLLAVQNLQKHFGPREILKDVSFTLHRGERMVLLGENGCGKSTLLQILARLQKADGGSITQHIDPTLGKRADRRWFRKVGVVYQNPNYQLFMPTVREELTFGAEDVDFALSLAEELHLTPLLDRHPHSLSEGQKRRVTIAAILAQKPELLLLDEPTVGQDFHSLSLLVEVLRKVHTTLGTAMIVVTHDFHCAQALCDTALWLEEGIIHRRGGKELVMNFFQPS